ncbi:MAG TPA: ABC transporter substrate-binding protein [Verrucomicrobiae bacterium]|nr:ABC transporter substrate-binding protein [Verrucomicrobiae bacterium]
MTIILGLNARRFGRSWLAGLWLAWLISIAVAAQEATTLRLGYFPNVTHAQALHARATGELDRSLGVPIKWTAFNAGPTAIESMLTDAVDATFIGPSPAINGYLKSRGEKVVVIAGCASGGAGLVVRTKSGIQGERDFADRVIATPQLGNTQDVAAREWFASHGYRLRDQGGNVTIIPLSNPDQLTMFKKRQIDAAWTVEPWLARLEVEGGGRVFLEEKSLAPDGQCLITLLVVNPAYLVRNKATVRKLLAGLVEITQRLNADKTAAATILNQQLKKETGKSLSPEVMEKAMRRVEFTWDPQSASLRRAAEAAHHIGFLRQPPALGGIYSLGLLNEVLREKNLPTVVGIGQ